MFDFKFDWSSDVECGFELIDQQHRELFRIARDIEQLIVGGFEHIETRRLLEIVCELREYVSYHFYTEEALMVKNHYERLAEHESCHNEFKNKILQIDLPTLGEHPALVLTRLKDDIQDWLFHHILTEDKELSRFLNSL